MICLFQELLSSPDIEFILTARFTQDALENLFSQIRGQGVPHPQPVRFRQALRLMCLGHFMMMPNSSNYEEDNNPMLLDFLKQYDGDDVISEDEYAINIPLSVFEEASCTVINDCESSGLYYPAGWDVFKELKTLLAMLVLKLFVCSMFSWGNFRIVVYSFKVV